jgi:hypothetical protein
VLASEFLLKVLSGRVASGPNQRHRCQTQEACTNTARRGARLSPAIGKKFTLAGPSPVCFGAAGSGEMILLSIERTQPSPHIQAPQGRESSWS